MKVETRKTAAGTEYWDNEEKRVLFVPAGEKPDFEVTENPESMLNKEEPAPKTDEAPDLKDMTVNQLKAYAAELDIEIPADVKNKKDIIALLSADDSE